MFYIKALWQIPQPNALAKNKTFPRSSYASSGFNWRRLQVGTSVRHPNRAKSQRESVIPLPPDVVGARIFKLDNETTVAQSGYYCVFKGNGKTRPNQTKRRSLLA